MNALFYAHSGLRYLVLLAAAVAVVYLGFALATRRAADRPGRILLTVYTGVLDLQILVGVALMLVGVYYPRLIGHLFMMLLAAGAAHAAGIVAKRTADSRRALQFRLIGVVLSVILLTGGIHVIARSVFGSGAPSVTAPAE